MELYKMMQNIRGINVEEEIKNSINIVRNELIGLTLNQTCLIYNSHLFEEMKKRHLNVRFINTLDLGLNYEHYFILIKGLDDFFVADLTFEQFNNFNFLLLLSNGYMKIDDNILNNYLSIIERKPVTGFTLDKLFYMDVNEIKR